MELFHGLVLGIIQGITEFFPVSSSGHLVLTPHLFGWEDQGIIFDTVVHGGTLVALLWSFGGELSQGVRKAVTTRDPEAKLFFVRLVIAAIPALFVGGLLGAAIEYTFRSPVAVAVSLAGWGIVLYIADRWCATHRPVLTDPRKVRWGRALLVGCAQAIAVIPGTSRSGITMTAGLFLGMDRKTAVDFSFFLSIPTITAAFAYGVLRMVQQGAAPEQFGMLAVGFVAAALTGFVAIRFLRSYVATHSFRPFVWYRLALAALILLIVL
jgi:undecaprenyl-diphosphatase